MYDFSLGFLAGSSIFLTIGLFIWAMTEEKQKSRSVRYPPDYTPPVYTNGAHNLEEPTLEEAIDQIRQEVDESRIENEAWGSQVLTMGLVPIGSLKLILRVLAEREEKSSPPSP